MKRPGVAMTISTPLRSSPRCSDMLVPPTTMAVRTSLEVLNHWYAKRCCFATASLCTPKHVPAFERNGNALCLNGGGLVILLMPDVSHDVLMQVLHSTRHRRDNVFATPTRGQHSTKICGLNSRAADTCCMLTMSSKASSGVLLVVSPSTDMFRRSLAS